MISSSKCLFFVFDEHTENSDKQFPQLLTVVTHPFKRLKCHRIVIEEISISTKLCRKFDKYISQHLKRCKNLQKKKNFIVSNNAR